jgi:hypothetical protein
MRSEELLSNLLVDVRRTPLFQTHFTNFASSYEKYAPPPDLVASLTALYHRNFTHSHLFRSLQAVHEPSIVDRDQQLRGHAYSCNACATVALRF